MASIVATPEKVLDHVNTAPEMGLPFESFAVAVNCRVAPTLMLAVIGKMETEATTGVTVRVTGELVTPSLVAVIWVVPTLRPVATPELSTLATLVALLFQVKVIPVTLFPLESRADAANG